MTPIGYKLLYVFIDNGDLTVNDTAPAGRDEFTIHAPVTSTYLLRKETEIATHVVNDR